MSAFFKFGISNRVRAVDENGNQHDDMSWWDKLLDRVEGRIHDLLEPGGEGNKDHSMANYVTCLEKAKGR